MEIYLGIFLFMSFITLCFYWADKVKAEKGKCYSRQSGQTRHDKGKPRHLKVKSVYGK